VCVYARACVCVCVCVYVCVCVRACVFARAREQSIAHLQCVVHVRLRRPERVHNTVPLIQQLPKQLGVFWIEGALSKVPAWA
jgi:hypothetical protein